MKKNRYIDVIWLVLPLVLMSGCSRIQEMVGHFREETTYEKIEDVHGILNEILTTIADEDSELTLDEHALLDSELGIARYDILPLENIPHITPEDVVDGLIVRPVTDENPHLIIIVKASDAESAAHAKAALLKVHADVEVAFADGSMMQLHLINNYELVRQGNFVIYLVWENAQELIRIFERHVR